MSLKRYLITDQHRPILGQPPVNRFATGTGIFPVYTGTSIARVFFTTAAGYGALSLYGYTIKTDLSRFGSYLLMGLIGIIIASLVKHPSVRHFHHRRHRVRRPDRIRHVTHQGDVS